MTSPHTRLSYSFALLSCLLLSQCTTIDPAKKDTIKKVVVACNVGNEITRYKVGFTAFGNDQLEPIRDSRIRSGVNRILREEIQNKFPTIVFIQEEPPQESQNILAATDYRSWAREVARKYQADAVLLVSGWYYYPYGSPAYLKAQGMGVWHLGKVGQVQCYARTMLVDAQGMTLGTYARYKTGQRISDLEIHENFAQYTLTDQQRIIDTCLAEFRAEVSSYLTGIGL